MFRTLFRHEVVNHLLTFRFAAALATTMVLVITISIFIGGDYQGRLDSFNVLSERSAAAAREARVPAMIQPVVYRLPSNLGIFAQGEGSRIGNSVKILRWSVPVKADDISTGNELMAVFRPFDMLSVFTLIISLFGILISHDAISGDRERGVLKLICANGVGKGIVLGSKYIAAVVILSLPVLIGWIGSILILQFAFGNSFSPAEWAALILMLIAVVLYGAFFIAVGMLCSALFRHSSSALVLALLIWTLAALLVPGAAVTLSELIEKPPSPMEVRSFEDDSLRALLEKRNEYRRSHVRPEGMQCGTAVGYSEDIQVYECTTLSPFTDMSRSENFINPDLWRWSIEIFKFTEELRQDRAEAVFKQNARINERKNEQKRLADALATISPAFQLKNVFSACANTDYKAQALFLERVRRHRTELLDGFRAKGYFGTNAVSFFTQLTNDDLEPARIERRFNYYTSRIRERGDVSKVLSADNWKPLPAELIPRFEDFSPSPRLDDCSLPLGCLFFMTALVFAVTFVLVLRYDVR